MPHAPLIPGSSAWPADGSRSVVTIGNFDGVHLGHRSLLSRTVQLASKRDVIPTAFTFDPAPRDVLRPNNPIARIQTLDDRVRELVRHGATRVVVEPFDLAYAAHDAEWFATEVLQRRLRAAAVVVGWDFRFGKARGGSVETLRNVLNVPVYQVDPFQLNEKTISSSRIRTLLAEGHVAAAAELLDRPHQVCGTVVHGDARGRTLGFPTANVRPQTELVPKAGVYAVRMDTPTATGVAGVANVGVRPTFGPSAQSVEVHLLDFDGDLYDAQVRVHFTQRLRDEQRFASVDGLVAQVTADVAQARALLAGAGPTP
ncbi:MAG: bifunctional riboflavin kinase/FAD synthetase [Myxococcota bacterium]